jgi:hypothetical protein
MPRAVAEANHFERYRGALTSISGLLALFILSLATQSARASLPDDVNDSVLTSVAAAPRGGYWVQVDGGVDNDENGGSRTIAIDGARQFASVPYRGSIAAIPGKDAYWVVTSLGQIFARGEAPALCNGYLHTCSGYPSAPTGEDAIVGAAASPDGSGLWAVDREGRVWTAGSTVSYGDVTSDGSYPTGIVATPSGLGYYIVLADGGVYSFGDAVFFGSTGGNKPGGHSATGLALSLDVHGQVNGYWMVFDDGGVFTFGDAPFLGSSGGDNGGSPVTSIAPASRTFPYPYQPSYVWVHENAQVNRSETLRRVTIGHFYPTGLVWGVSTTGNPADILLLTSRNQGCTQIGNFSCSEVWIIWPASTDGTIVQLVNVYSGLCADVSSNTSGTYLIEYTCKGKTENWDNQRFLLKTYPDGRVDFFPVSSPQNHVVPGEDSRLTLSSLHFENWVLNAR